MTTIDTHLIARPTKREADNFLNLEALTKKHKAFTFYALDVIELQLIISVDRDYKLNPIDLTMLETDVSLKFSVVDDTVLITCTYEAYVYNRLKALRKLAERVELYLTSLTVTRNS